MRTAKWTFVTPYVSSVHQRAQAWMAEDVVAIAAMDLDRMFGGSLLTGTRVAISRDAKRTGAVFTSQ